jgi:carbamoyltransferase
MGEMHSATVYHGRDGKLVKLHSISAHDSIGVLYSLITLHLGFDFNSDEYKIMGLAPYGDRRRFREFFDSAVEFSDNGSIRIPLLRLNETRDERENYLRSRHYLSENLSKERRPEDEITDEHKDIAAGLQDCLDKTMQHLCGHFGKQTGLRRLALAGGVALNCTANGKLLKSDLFDEIYVQPAAGDDGTALGAALYRASLAGEVKNTRMRVPFYGPAYSLQEI